MNDTMPRHYDVLIVGGGHGGAQAAIALRQAKFAGTLAIVGEELELPYERPPLSKDYLAGAKLFERILIRPPTFWTERGIDMLLGRRVDRIDAVARTVTCADGSVIGYGDLIWAAGGHARRLTCTGHALIGVHSVRSRADVDQLARELDDTTRICVVGGGYIGLEAAAVLAKLGKQVVVVEAQSRLLARVAGVALSDRYAAEHRAHGVDVRLSTNVDCIEERDGRAVGVRLAGGEVVACEMVIVGIGIVPAVEPLRDAGAAGDNGVFVDAQCRTTLSHIYAIGDCAQHANGFADDAHIRVESVQNANDMASVAAKSIVGEDVAYTSVPWFWSNQYELRLQTVGLSIGHDAEVVRGDPASASFSIVYLKQGRVVALDCINAVKDYVQGRALVVARAEVAAVQLADASTPLKAMIGTPR